MDEMSIVIGFIFNVYAVVVWLALITRLRYTFPAVLLIFIPFVNIFALAIFAFRRSPLEEEVIELRARVLELEAYVYADPVPTPAKDATKAVES